MVYSASPPGVAAPVTGTLLMLMFGWTMSTIAVACPMTGSSSGMPFASLIVPVTVTVFTNGSRSGSFASSDSVGIGMVYVMYAVLLGHSSVRLGAGGDSIFVSVALSP